LVANGLVDKDYIHDVVEHFEPGDFAVFQNEISNVDYAMQCCHAKGLRVVFNPSPMTDKLLSSGVWEFVDDLFINETEGFQITGKNDPEEILMEMKARYPHCRTILTLGSDGSIMLVDGEFVRQAAYKCEAVDTTGAGDTFSGFFTALSAAGRTYKEALDLASRASSLAVRKKGASAAIPTLQEVLDAWF
ncbi:MAG: ribokinase, partial [Pseudobutyrivibrio sp.]|nr:ribokinase [Pseudobutyrivibrio sp.]